MPNSEFIAHWNSVIVDFKITEYNLNKPDENFVFKALINLLKLFNYDTEMMLQKANTGSPEEKLILKIEFCRIIEKLYSSSDKKLTFRYLNLIQPLPKKTVHLLKYLFNYHLYCNMFREEIFSKVDEAIEERKKLKEIEKHNQIENENIEKKSNMIDQKLLEYDKLLPQLTEKINKFRTEKDICEENVKKFEENLKLYENLIVELQSKKDELKNEIVSDSEIEKLLTRKALLEAEIKEQLEIERVTRESNQARSESIQKLKNDIKSIELVLEMHSLNLEDFVSAKELRQKLIQLKNDLKFKQLKYEKMCADIETFNEQINKNEIEFEVKKNSYEKQLAELKEELSKIEIVENKVKSINGQLNKSLNSLDTEVDERIQVRKFMLEFSQKMFELFLTNASELLTSNGLQWNTSTFN